METARGNGACASRRALSRIAGGCSRKGRRGKTQYDPGRSRGNDGSPTVLLRTTGRRFRVTPTYPRLFFFFSLFPSSCDFFVFFRTRRERYIEEREEVKRISSKGTRATRCEPIVTLSLIAFETQLSTYVTTFLLLVFTFLVGD